MQWRNRRQSQNVEDQRGMGRALPVGGGIGTIVLALVVYFMGGDPRVVLDQNSGGSAPSPSISRQANPQNNGQPDEAKQFVSVVLADTEDVWSELFRQRGGRYRNPKLVLFSGQVRSACGVAGASAGPFYCPDDEKLYIDLAFFREIKTRFGAPGNFAQAYVLAHEVGHHVQNQLGTLEKVQNLQSRVSKAQSNQLSVRLELQADYYAGVWAHYAKKRGDLDPGDIEEALGAASAVGDDRLQRETQGYAVPDSFTHGSSQQRVEWFGRGLQSGDPQGGNTFGAEVR
ncbi:MAG: zinc metallopeptidase [Armatimonadetes bacterium]|nr:zinc metallopeptidase [Armatimonadota bacterium]